MNLIKKFYKENKIKEHLFISKKKKERKKDTIHREILMIQVKMN